MTEQQLQAKILKDLDKRGCYTFKTITCNRAGVPDIIACTPTGKFLAIEVKLKHGIVSELQQFNISQILARTTLCVVVYSYTDYQQFISYIIETNQY